MSQPNTNGIPTVVPTLFPENVALYVHGVADDTQGGVRGGGAPFVLTSSSTNPDIKTLSWSYLDYIYLAGGDINYSGAQAGDSATFALAAPASVVTANAQNTGNCTVQNGLIVPSQGQGGYDLQSFVPLPAPSNKGVTTGLWDWSMPDTGLGTIAPNYTQTGGYHLLSVAKTLGVFAQKMPLLGTNKQTLTLPAVKAKLILPQWRFTVTLANTGHMSALVFTWALTTGRTTST